MADILETLEAAEYNLKQTNENPEIMKLRRELATQQIHNARTLLFKRRRITEDVDLLLSKYGTAERVPLAEA